MIRKLETDKSPMQMHEKQDSDDYPNSNSAEKGDESPRDSPRENQSTLEVEEQMIAFINQKEKAKDSEEITDTVVTRKPVIDTNTSESNDDGEEEPILEKVPSEPIQDKDKSCEDSQYDFDHSLEEDQSPPPSFTSSLSSRRKQTTPTKKPVPPGESSTVLITHGGHLQAPDPETPEKNRIETSESDTTPSKEIPTSL